MAAGRSNVIRQYLYGAVQDTRKILLATAGEGAILAGQAEPRRECSMAVSGDRVAW
jgi:hypothetical protein